VLGEDGEMRSARLGVPLAAGLGHPDEHAAPIVLAEGPFDQAVLLQAGDRTRQRALAQVHVRQEILHAALVTVGLDEPVECLELAHADLVGRLQFAIELARDLVVAGQQRPPPAHQLHAADPSMRAHQMHMH
jgi:hypothetical protein